MRLCVMYNDPMSEPRRAPRGKKLEPCPILAALPAACSDETLRGDVTTNRIEGFFAGLKRQIGGTHHSVSKKHLHRYVSEVEFKYNTRQMKDGERLDTAIQAANGKRLRYRDQVQR
jgi:hypothetical protein